MKKISCCSQEVKVSKQGADNNVVFIYRCPQCKKQSEGKTPAEAVEKWDGLFNNSSDKIGDKESDKKGAEFVKQSVDVPAISKPTSPANIETWADQHLPELIKKSAQWLGKSAQQRMIEKNLNYIINHKGLTKIWGTPEGQDSIVKALEESNWYGADMPEMGSILPFKKECKFVPEISVYKVALTQGIGAEFEWVEIVPVYEKDIVKRGRKNDDYYFEIEEMFPRGELIGVVCWGKLKIGKRVGQSYDIHNLTEKAKQYSESYKASIVEQNEFNLLKTEGKTKIIDGRECYEKKIKGTEGRDDWTKKIFYDEIINPYTGASKEKMFCKLAGKSFFKEYMKRRNAMAMAGAFSENENSEDGNKNLSTEKKIDSILQIAKENVSVPEKVENVFEGEIVDEGDDRI